MIEADRDVAPLVMEAGGEAAGAGVPLGGLATAPNGDSVRSTEPDRTDSWSGAAPAGSKPAGPAVPVILVLVITLTDRDSKGVTILEPEREPVVDDSWVVRPVDLRLLVTVEGGLAPDLAAAR